jgi:hypothetical protein
MKRKIISGMTAAALLFVMALTGCKNPASGGGNLPSVGIEPEPEPELTGVLGQVSGIVFDSVTARPLADVAVGINSGICTRTDSTGTFKIADLPPGTYDIAYYKDGYRYQAQTIQVDPAEYKTDDPFGEFQSLDAMLAALNTWVRRVPDGGGPASGWSYQDGIWVSGDGETAVTVNPETFEIRPVKLDYVYRKGINTVAQPLVPLTGAIRGRIRLVKTPFDGISTDDLLNWKLANMTAVQQDVQVWLVDTAGYTIGSASASPNITYGPVKTGANGSFQIAGVPVNTALGLRVGGFTQDGHYFAPAGAAYSYDYDSNGFTVTSFIAQNNGLAPNAEDQTYTDAGEVFLFAEGSYALVIDHKAGSPVAPLMPDGKITLTFSKQIDPATFTAALYAGSGGNFDSTTDTSLPLKPNWTANNTVVELIPAKVPGGYLKPVFPYSSVEAVPLGVIGLTGKAADGSRILASPDAGTGAADRGIPVYVTESLKYLGMEIVDNSAGSISRAVARDSDVIKLNFNKALDPHNVTVTLGNRVPDYKVGETSLYVFVDALAGTNQALSFTVVSASDSEDVCASPAGISFDKAQINRKLVLASLTGIDYIWAGNAIIDSSFPINEGSITLTFTRDIPEGATVRAAMSKAALDVFPAKNVISLDSTVVPINISWGGSAVTVRPDVPLAYNTAYYMAIEIEKDREIIFGGDQIGDYGNMLLQTAVNGTYHSISFRTEKIALVASVVSVFGPDGGAFFDTKGMHITRNYINGMTADLSNGPVTFYVLFDNPVLLTDTPPANDVYRTTDSNNVEFVVVPMRSHPNMLSVTVQKARGAVAHYNSNVVLSPYIKKINTDMDNAGIFYFSVRVKWNK